MEFYYQVEGKIRNNIGDILQGMVAKQFIPENPHVVDREALSDMGLAPSLLIGNGWYIHSFEKFPPPPNVKPIYVSVHIANSKLLTKSLVREHFIENAPIGCRDDKTLKLLLGWGIPAYNSSCLTTTTARRVATPATQKKEYLLVDNVDHQIPESVKIKLENLLDASLVRISHDPPDTSGDIQEYSERNEALMDELLTRYCQAAMVITTKIHCALPCLGMGANVMLIHPNPGDPRLATVREFIDIISYETIMASTKIPNVKVNHAALAKRQSFLREIVTKSIQKRDNILKKPDRTGLIFLKSKSFFLAKFYRLVVRSLLASGFASAQMKRVYATGE